MSVIVGSKSLKPDFLWEQPKLVLEYDSDEFHLDAAQKSRDEARRRVFENLGYTVKCLTSDILVDNAKLNAFISELESAVSPQKENSKRCDAQNPSGDEGEALRQRAGIPTVNEDSSARSMCRLPSAMAAFRYRCLPPYTKLDEGHAERSTLHKIQFGPRFFHLNWLFALHTGAKHQDRVSKHLPWSQKYVALSEFCATIKGQRSPNRIMCTRDRKKEGRTSVCPSSSRC